MSTLTSNDVTVSAEVLARLEYSATMRVAMAVEDATRLGRPGNSQADDDEMCCVLSSALASRDEVRSAMDGTGRLSLPTARFVANVAVSHERTNLSDKADSEFAGRAC